MNLQVCVGDKVTRFVQINALCAPQFDDRVPEQAGRIGLHGGAARLFVDLEVDGGVDGGVFDHPDVLVGHEILLERLLLARHQPREIRLVVREDAGHQLDVGAVLVRQVAVPRLAEIAAAPCPLFLARRNVPVRDVEQTGLHAVIVPADEVVVRFVRHVGRRHRDVLVPGDVDAFRVVHLVVRARRDRKTRHVPLPVVEHRNDVRRENGLGMIVDRDGGVGPPEERLRLVGPVVELAADLEIRLARIERKPGGHFRAVHPVDLADPDRRGTVAARFIRILDGPERVRPVMLRPVEFDAARDPRAGEADQRRFDDPVVVHEIVLVRLVERAVDPAAEIRHDLDPEILVLEHDDPVLLHLLLVLDLVDHRMGVDPSRAALVDALLQKHRVLVRLPDAVSRNGGHLFPYPDGRMAASALPAHRIHLFDRVTFTVTGGGGESN